MKTRNKWMDRSLSILGCLGLVFFGNDVCLGRADVWGARFCAFPAFECG